MAECHCTSTGPRLQLRHWESPANAGTLLGAAGCSQEQLLFVGMDVSAWSTASLQSN